jgi:hypothetical protein
LKKFFPNLDFMQKIINKYINYMSTLIKNRIVLDKYINFKIRNNIFLLNKIKKIKKMREKNKKSNLIKIFFMSIF